MIRSINTRSINDPAN